jgi:hypothetical protein
MSVGIGATYYGVGKTEAKINSPSDRRTAFLVSRIPGRNLLAKRLTMEPVVMVAMRDFLHRQHLHVESRTVCISSSLRG